MANEYINIQKEVDGLIGNYGSTELLKLLKILKPVSDKLSIEDVSTFTLRIVCKMYDVDFDTILDVTRKTGKSLDVVDTNILLLNQKYDCSLVVLANIHKCSDKNVHYSILRAKEKIKNDIVFSKRYNVIESRLNQFIKTII